MFTFANYFNIPIKKITFFSMKTIYSKLTMVACAAFIGFGSVGAVAPCPDNFDLTRLRYQIDTKDVFSSARAKSVANANYRLQADRDGMRRVANPKPELTLGPKSAVGDMDAPNGERWFYSAEFDYDSIPPHDEVVFTDYILKYYKFDIYDAEAKYVGTIQDRMDYAPDEVRVPLCELAPIITRNFFNTDDNLEFIVGVAVNAGPGNNHYRSLVYTLGNAKDADGDDVPVFTFNNLIGDVIEGPAEEGKDNFYIALMDDKYPQVDGDSFWDYIMAANVQIDVYGRALDASGPRKLLDKNIPLLQLPGDQMSVPALITLREGNDVYFMLSWYELPFFNRYDDPINDELSQREGNHLVCAFYKAEGDGIEYQYETKIDVVHDVVERQVEEGAEPFNDCIYSYYSVGNLRYTGDINFTGYNTPAGRAALIVTRGNFLISTDDTVNSYFVYGPDGNRMFTLWENADSSLALSDLPGFPPQQMFVGIGPYGYEFNFVNLLTGKKDLVLDYQYYYDDDNDPEQLTANLDRVPVGDSYEYCVELRMPTIDEDENDIMRFIWIDKKGKFDRFDYVNMGSNVLYAMSYISSDACVPGAYTEEGLAYMMLVKRGIAGSATNEELLVARPLSEKYPQGEQLLLCGPDSRGVLSSIIPVFGHGGEIDIYRSSVDRRFHALDVYGLPLDANQSGVESVAADGGISFNGTSVVASGKVAVYTTAGAIVATGNGTADLSGLAPGLYIVVADGATCKVIVK